MTDPRKILIRGPNWVGDVVMATPVIRAVRIRFPEAEVHLLLRAYVAPVVAGWDVVDHIHAIEPADGRGLRQAWRVGRRLRGEKFDAALLLTNSMTSALEAYFAGIPRRIGYRGDLRSVFLTDALAAGPRFGRREPVPMVDFYGKLIDVMGAEVADRHYFLQITPEQDAAVEDYFHRHGIEGEGPLVGITPGAKFGSSKLWMAGRFAAAADRIQQACDARILLLGGPGEEPILNEVASSMEGSSINTATEIIPLGVLKAVVNRLDLMITNDTGPRAIAQAFGVPTVVVMGSTDPRWTAANNELATVLRHDVPCGPCHKKVCDLDHRCMDLVTVDQVSDAAIAALKNL